jgi:hypothetical protein
MYDAMLITLPPGRSTEAAMSILSSCAELIERTAMRGRDPAARAASGRAIAGPPKRHHELAALHSIT